MGLERKQPAEEQRDASGDGLVVEAVYLDDDASPDGFVVTITEALHDDGGVEGEAGVEDEAAGGGTSA